MKIAMLSPIAWRTPPRQYGAWETVVSTLTEELVKQGADITLFATADSLTAAKLEAVCPRPYAEDPTIDAKVWECLHISHLFDQADRFDIIHNHFDFLPLTYSGLVSTPVITTIHGFSSEKIVPVYKKYNQLGHYVAISNADRHAELTYLDTIYHGIDIERFSFTAQPGEYLAFMGRVHPDKGAADAIKIAKLANRQLIMAGIVQDEEYFEQQVKPHIDGEQIQFIGSIGPDARDKLLAEAMAFLHPIEFAEPFGLSVVESQACGTPVIAFNKGSMPEVIDDGQTGYLVNGVEEAVDCLKDIPHLSRQQCRRWVEHKFSKQQMAENYLGAYKQVLGRS
jgi:glycosyltransferase involved in cell wall biosynthesis